MEAASAGRLGVLAILQASEPGPGWRFRAGVPSLRDDGFNQPLAARRRPRTASRIELHHTCMTSSQATTVDQAQGRGATDARIDDAVLDRALEGHGLEGLAPADGTPRAATPSLRTLSARGPVLLVFLRHYG